jgi:predicted  nucleic acid-binding Zn-ribbon protein
MQQKKSLTVKIQPIITEVSKLKKIKTSKDMSGATELLSKLNQTLDTLTTEKEKITKPMNEALLEVRARYKPAETALNDAIKTIRTEMSSYQTELLRIKKTKEDEMANALIAGKVDIDKASTALSNMKKPEQKVVTDGGSISFRTDQILKVTAIDKIPHEYFDLNEKKVLSALKLGKSIPGAEIELIQTPINRR